jgi:tRNA U54 and U55 pseudouridine synthase Pus10
MLRIMTQINQSKQSEANKRHYEALAELEKQFVQWRMLSPRIEEEAAARMNRLAELSKKRLEEGSAMIKSLIHYHSSTTSEEVTEGVESMEEGLIRTRPANRILSRRSKQVSQP